MRYLLIVALLGLWGCDGHEASDPVTRCIAFGHEVSECIQLARVIHCCQCGQE